MSPGITLASLLVADIADPTDFPDASTAPGLRALDSALRCTICSELFDAPVTLACGHCFCSLCARGSIAEKAECPSCRQTSSEVHLRPNPAIEEVVVGWKKARPFMLQLIARAEEGRSSRPPSSANTTPSKREKKRRRLSDSEEDEDVEIVVGPSRVSLRTTDQSGFSVPSPSRKSSGSSLNRLSSSRKNSGKGRLPTEEDDMPQSDDLVQCPACQVFLNISEINGHLDSGCKPPSRTSQKKQQWSNIFVGAKTREKPPKEPLPKVSYSVLKDKQLKALLTEQKLSVAGDRPQLEARHKRWVMLWNANMDRAPVARRLPNDLRSDLRRWEDEQARAAATAKARLSATDDVREHQRKHKSEFSRLTEEARARARSKVLVGESSADIVENLVGIAQTTIL